MVVGIIGIIIIVIIILLYGTLKVSSDYDRQVEDKMQEEFLRGYKKGNE